MPHFAIVLAWCLQAQSAEEIYKQFEKKLDEAKSVSVRIRTELTSTDPDKSIAADLSLCCKPGDKYKVVVRSSSEEAVFVADGKNYWSRKSKKEEWHDGSAPKGMSRAFVRGFTRWSLLAFLYLSRGDRPEAVDAIEVGHFGQVTGTRIGDREVVELRYGVKTQDQKWGARLWLEKGTLVPVRRTFFSSDENGAAILTEHYEDFSTDEVPDSEFRNPKEESDWVSVTLDSWEEDIQVDLAAMTIVHTRMEYEYARPQDDIPSDSKVVKLLDGKITREQADALKKFVRECGFLDLKDAYGAPENQRYYPYRLTVAFSGDKKKSVEFRSNPEFEGKPEAYQKLEKYLVDLSKEVRDRKK